MTNESSRDPKYFSTKGARAEQVVHRLAEQTFFSDWCFLNPKFPDGRELCDLLVAFDDVAVVFQVKDLKLDSDGRYSVSELQKNLRQLTGARRRLIELKSPIQLANARRKIERFDAESIRRVYLISVLMGQGEEVFSFVEEVKRSTVHVFTRDFVPIVLAELDTVADFIDYLDAKEALIKEQVGLSVVGGEEELLGVYLLNGRSFDPLRGVNLAFLDAGFWSKYTSSPQVRAKRDADSISYGWDSFVDMAHECGPDYEEIARELARPNRFERRVLGKAFGEAYFQASAVPSNRNLFRRHLQVGGRTYVFLFYEGTRDQRRSMLEATCTVARALYRANPTVLGVATELRASASCSYDFCFMPDLPWTDADQERALKLQLDAKIFTDVRLINSDEDEYPDLAE